MLKKILVRGGIAVVTMVVILLITITLRWDRRFDVPYPRVAASTDPAMIPYTAPRLAGGFEMETGGTPSIKVVPPNIAVTPRVARGWS